MREIGVRELKSSLSSVLHEVEEGEQVRVTIRGRAVADIVPTAARALERATAGARRQRPGDPCRAAAAVPAGAAGAGEAFGQRDVLAERDAER